MTTTVTPDPEAIRPEFDGDAVPTAGPRGGRGSDTTSLRLGVATLWLSVIVLLPLAAIAWQAASGGWHAFWLAVTSNAALESFRVTLTISAGVTLVNLIFGLLIAWVLVRDDFVGKRLVDAIIDLPFALPTIVASLVMLALYGNNSPVGLHLQHTAWGVALVLLWGAAGAFGFVERDLGFKIIFGLPGIVLASIFVTLPFVVREVEPVLHELGTDQEEAAATLGSGWWQTFWRITLPSIRWGLTYGIVLTIARTLGEFGAVIIVSSNLPGKSQTLTLLVADRYNRGAEYGAYALSTLLMGVAVLVLIFQVVLDVRRARATK